MCKSKNIKADFNIQLPGQNPISDVELVSLFANLLDNAITASEISEQPFVKLRSKIKDSQWIIIVRNTKSPDWRPIESKFLTTKKEKENHGYGIKIIKSIVKKQDGIVDFTDEGAIFICRCAIPIENEELSEISTKE